MIAALEKNKVIPTALEGEFNNLLSSTFVAEPAWLREKRKVAFVKFNNKGIPTRKEEDYKYTDLQPVFKNSYTAIHNELHKDIPIPSPIENGSIQLVFVNGWLYKDSTLSAKLPSGVIVGNLASEGVFQHAPLLKEFLGTGTDAVSSLNEALWTDGTFVYVPKNTLLETPIEIIHISTGDKSLLSNPRHLIILENHAQAQIIERTITYKLEASQVLNAYSQVVLKENARLQYYRIQDSCQNVSQISGTRVSIKQNAHFDTNNLATGNTFVRNNLHIDLEGENIETHLNGMFFVSDHDFIDNHTAVKHGSPNCQSNQLYKGILDGHSTGIFNGKIYVARDAQKTNAFQSSKNILLSDDATINTKPELEIYADDVKCSHGSTTGQLDEDSVFYLRTRGLSEDSAKKLLLVAFANDVLNTIQIDSVKQYFESVIQEKLENVG